MTPSIKQGQEVKKMPLAKQLVLAISMLNNDWREPFIRYLTSAEVPTKEIETERLIHRSKHYVLVDGKLMHKNAKEEILQKCIPREEGVQILREIHAGSCGNLAASRNLVSKAFRVGFYWPSAITDAESLVRRCEGCQLFAKSMF
jgi:hypothetical protein